MGRVCRSLWGTCLRFGSFVMRLHRKTPDDRLWAAKLQAHLLLVDAADSISIGRIDNTLNEEKAERSLKLLQQNCVVIPSDVRNRLWQVRVARLVEQVSTGNMESLQALLARCLPWVSAGEGEDITFANIRLGDLDGTPGMLAKRHWDTIMGEIMLPMCLSAEPPTDILRSICDFLLKGLDLDDMPDCAEYETMSCDILNVCRLLSGLLTPSCMDSLVADRLQAIRTAKGRDGIALFRDFLRSHPFWVRCVAEFDAAKPFHVMFAPEINDARNFMKGSQPVDANSADGFAKYAEALSKWEAKLRTHACDKLREDMAASFKEWVSTVNIDQAAPGLLLATERALKAAGCPGVPLNSES